MAQHLLDKEGAQHEQSAPIAYLEIEEGGNIASAYAADGTHLANIGYRPYNEKLQAVHYLFLT